VSLYVCEKCNTIENTALANFWPRRLVNDGKALCSACDPAIGKWHGRFDRTTYDGTQNVQWFQGRWLRDEQADG
jgi:hypothetical protein